MRRGGNATDLSDTGTSQGMPAVTWGACQGAQTWGPDTERKTNARRAARRFQPSSLPAFPLLTCPQVIGVATQQEAESSWLQMNRDALSCKLAFLGGRYLWSRHSSFQGVPSAGVTFPEMPWPIQTPSVQLGKHRHLGLTGEEGLGEQPSQVGPRLS